MTDMTAFELKLVASLQRHLGERRPVDARSIAAVAMSTTAGQAIPLGRRWPRFLGGERSGQRMRSLAWVAVATALLLAALALAFLAGQQPPQPVLPPPSPTQPVLPAVSPTQLVLPTLSAPLPTPLPLAGPFRTVLMRDSAVPGAGVDVVVVAADGSERLIRTVMVTDDDLVANGFAPGHTVTMGDFATISSDGWLAAPFDVNPPSGIAGSNFYAFYDLGNSATPSLVGGFWGVASGVWGPNGLFAAPGSVNQSLSGMQIIDPGSHSITHMGAHMLGGGPTIFWAADGSGLLGFALPDVLGIFPVDDSLPIRGVPSIADKVGARQFGLNGLAICQPDSSSLFFGEHDPACLAAGLATQSLDNEVVAWASNTLLGGRVTAGSFAADRTALWAVVRDRTSTAPVSIVRLEDPGNATVVATIENDGLRGIGHTFGFGGLAPDDSIIVLRGADDSGLMVQLVVPMDDTAPTVHLGQLAGFVPASLADSWPTVELP